MSETREAITPPLMIDAAGALNVEIGHALAFVALLLWIVFDTGRRGELRHAALCAIGGCSIFWQEFYAGWGGYLLWSDAFPLMPWGSTLWTTPNKPWHTPSAFGAG